MASAADTVIEFVPDASGWVLGKNQVQIDEAGEVRKLEAGFVADYEITVSHGDTSFSTSATAVPCDKDGIPSEEAVTKLLAAL